ncbi:MAG: hypothetical protein KC657_31150 [Myxococcales bacterium]|nr:hypothetical protein [Myxococcales bacterium]
MSYSFFVTAPDGPPAFSKVVGGVGLDGVVCVEPPRANDGWPLGEPFHFLMRGRSAREVEVGFEEEGAFHVRILTCAARVDYELAMAFIDAIAKLTKGTIHPEDGDGVPWNERERAFGSEWIDKMVEWGPKMVADIVEREGNMLSLRGPNRVFHFGRRLLAELRKSGDHHVFSERLLEMSVRLQWLEGTFEQPKPVLTLPRSRRDPAAGFTSIEWRPETRCFLPGGDYLALDAAEKMFVPYAKGPELAGDKWTYLDEVQAIVEPLSLVEWAAMLKNASKHRVDA